MLGKIFQFGKILQFFREDFSIQNKNLSPTDPPANSILYQIQSAKKNFRKNSVMFTSKWGKSIYRYRI